MPEVSEYGIMSHIGCQRNDDEGFQPKNLVSKKETNQNFPYLILTLTVSVVWFSYVTGLATIKLSYLHPIQ